MVAKMESLVAEKELNIEKAKFAPKASLNYTKSENNDFSSSVDLAVVRRIFSLRTRSQVCTMTRTKYVSYVYITNEGVHEVVLKNSSASIAFKPS